LKIFTLPMLEEQSGPHKGVAMTTMSPPEQSSITQAVQPVAGSAPEAAAKL
jgi:hypothetical protein